ncbi:abscisic acid 8'-hydroxylase 2-like [Cicer arietinum]|uniref:Abscisic acid 8'-hydroxylase 2-like n=1 Tax=Cicer arietinum TaxID=3827 RepID=A0A1S2YJQ3_CICAR|nr:abscisic acid 8'-hydroxylase 2-like [Cicer arietinum]
MQLFFTSFTNSCLDSSFFFILLSLFFSSFFILIPFLQWWQHHRNKDKRLPPGSMGWPYFGETLMLYTQNPNSFFSKRQKRYGDIFKTHILGCPCVMISNPEAARTVLVTQAHLFKPTYPPSKEKMIGPEALFFQQGVYHSMLKKLVQASFLPSTIKNSVSHVDQIVQKLLPTWTNRTINTLQEMKKYAFEVAANSAFGEIKELEMEKIRELYGCLEKGYNSYPLHLPGTSYWKAMKARKVLNEIIRKIIERRKERRNYGEGLLGILLRGRGDDDERRYQLSDSQVADNLIGVIFAAHDTTASVLTWILKYLHDNLNLLESLTKEQQQIQNKLAKESRGLSWEDTRQMPFTSRVK